MAAIQIGQPSYGLLDTSIPAQAALAPIKGAGAVNELVAQNLQNEASQFEMQNALAEQEAYKQAAQGQGSVQQNLLGAGLGGKAAAYGKTMAEAQKLGLEGRLKQAEIHRDRLNVLAGDPSDMNLMKYYQNGVASGEFTPEQAQQSWAKMQGLTSDQRRQELLPQAMKMDQYTKYLTDQAQLKISQQNANIAGGHLGLARERLAQETAGGSLTPETVDMAANMFLRTGQLPQLGMGKQAAAARQAILNRATVLGTTGGEGQPAPTTADVAGNVVSAKQDYKSQEKATKDFATGMQGRQVNSFNTAIDHLATMDKLSDALANGDTKAINAIGNMVAKQTGAPAPTSFNAAKQIVTAEVIKSIVASGGGVKERQEAEANFAAANSPAQLKGVINAYKDLMGGQLKSLELQYGNTTGRKDFEKKLTPAAKETLGKLKTETLGIPQGAIDALKSGKGTREQFDQIFGAGASDKILGKGK